MEISLEWLQDFVDLPSTSEVCDKLQQAGIEVDAVADPAECTSGVVVGEVLECSAHPKADRLKLCRVTDGTETFQVVCGAPNVGAGQIVPFAPIGARVGPIEIAARKLRGVESQGMICSREELGLQDTSDGIWVLPASYIVGRSIFEQGNLAPVLSLGVTPNRPDLLSHLGVARELAAATGQRLKTATWRMSAKGPEAAGLARVLVEDVQACKRYVARVVREIKVGPSPLWLQERLLRVGQRPVNNVVDATNYVLFELGQPMHAFDLAQLGVENGMPVLKVRRALSGEQLTTLDDVNRELSTEDLVIADPDRVLALAGVMGGASSEVTEDTRAVLLESAYFDPVVVRRASRRHGLHTESSHRFERGADPLMPLRAADRCAQLLNEIAGGQTAKGHLEVAQKKEAPIDVTLRLGQLPRILGVTLPAETVVQLLDPLDIRCTARNEDGLHFQIPSFRPDLIREIDLVEEIARRHGYESIPETLPSTGGDFRYEPRSRPVHERARGALQAAGFAEAVTFGFGSPNDYLPYERERGAPLRLLNPLGEELSVLRTTLLPNLLRVLAHNQRHGAKDVRLFEIGRTFHTREPEAEADERDRPLPRETERLGFVLCGGRHHGRWYEGGQTVDFTDAVGVVELIVAAFDPAEQLIVERGSAPELNPHGTAQLSLGDVRLGYVGQLHPQRSRAWELEGPVYVAELDLGVLGEARSRTIEYRSLPKYPGTRRDLALVVGQDVAAEVLRQYVYDTAGGDLGTEVVESVRLFDVYEGKSIAEGKRSLAFAIEYRSSERTLKDEEVARAFSNLIKEIENAFDVEIR